MDWDETRPLLKIEILALIEELQAVADQTAELNFGD